MVERNRSVQAAIPMIFIHGVIPFTATTTPTALTWSHVHNQTSDFHLCGTCDRLTVLKGVATAGLYNCSVSAGAVKAAGNPVELTLELYKNGVICECATAHSSIGAGSEHSDAVLNLIIYLEIGDYLEVFVSVDAGTATVEDDSARFILTALPMKGWNNSRSGALRRRGDVDR